MTKENDGSSFIFLRDKENDGSFFIFLRDKENDGSSFIFLREKENPPLFSCVTKKMMAPLFS